jgi:hypothetical protein
VVELFTITTLLKKWQHNWLPQVTAMTYPHGRLNTVIEKLGLTYPDPGAVVDNPEDSEAALTTRDEHATVTGTVGTLIATGALQPEYPS